MAANFKRLFFLKWSTWTCRVDPIGAFIPGEQEDETPKGQALS